MTAAQKPSPAGTPPARPDSTSPGSDAKKRWVRKGPIQVVLNQIPKQEKRVAELKEQLSREQRELEKLLKVKEALEAK